MKLKIFENLSYRLKAILLQAFLLFLDAFEVVFFEEAVPDQLLDAEWKEIQKFRRKFKRRWNAD